MSKHFNENFSISDAFDNSQMTGRKSYTLDEVAETVAKLAKEKLSWKVKQQMRFEAACAAMTGVLSNAVLSKANPIQVAEWSTLYADTLLVELEKENE